MLRFCDVCEIPLNVERMCIGNSGGNKVNGFNTSVSVLRSDEGVRFGRVWLCNECYGKCLNKIDWEGI